MYQRVARIIQIAFLFLILSLVGLGVSFWLSQKHPSFVTNAALQKEPLQVPIQLAPFDVDRSGVKYRIDPLFSYDISGLIVSSHDSQSFFDISHKSWGDHINTGDLCLIWGGNLTSGSLASISFQSGDWTCYASTKDSSAWNKFDMTKLSNNHVLPASREVEAQLRQLSIGDEVRLQGYLVNYGILGNPIRHTSTTRTDTGDGACEIIWVQDVKVMTRHNLLAIRLQLFFKILLGVSVITTLFAAGVPLFQRA